MSAVTWDPITGMYLARGRLYRTEKEALAAARRFVRQPKQCQRPSQVTILSPVAYAAAVERGA